METAELERKANELLARNAFASFNHLELELVEPDHAIFRLEVRPESKNPYGFVHGGILAGMADNAAGYAAHSDGRTYVTQSIHLNYISNQSDGVVRAEGRVLHRGRTTCVTGMEIRGKNGALMATGELVYFCVDFDALEKHAGK